MRNILLVSWLLLPIGAWAYHEGPGQDRTALDATDAVLVAAHAAADAGQWKEAVRQYEEALKALPKNPDAVDKRVTQRLLIELNKARMQASGLPDAREELASLVDQMVEDKDSDPQLLRDARHALARSQFYTTWLMRLEGLEREVWEPEVEAARQNYRLLAEQATDAKEAATMQGDVEAAIRLARMEIEDLQGLPLPSE
ncbi:MAG: tetratricopeptide repeat protein [Planctomycetota bacterium]